MRLVVCLLAAVPVILLSAAEARACSCVAGPILVQPAKGAQGVPTNTPILASYGRDGALLRLRSAAGEEVPLDVLLSLGGTESCGGIRLLAPQSPLAPDTAWTLSDEGQPSAESFTTGPGPSELPDVVLPTMERNDVQLSFLTGGSCESETYDRLAVLVVTPAATGSFALLDASVAYRAGTAVRSRILQPGTEEVQIRIPQPEGAGDCVAVTIYGMDGAQVSSTSVCSAERCLSPTGPFAFGDPFDWSDAPAACPQTDEVAAGCGGSAPPPSWLALIVAFVAIGWATRSRA